MGQAYRLPSTIRCEICQRELNRSNTFFFIEKDMPYTFCDPPHRPCFNNWYKVMMSPENLRHRGLL